MIPDFAQNLNIVNANFDDQTKKIVFYIEVDEESIFLNQYELILREIEGKHYPDSIVHGIRGHECFCGCSEKQSMFKECEFLTKYVDEIFEVLRERNELRLHFLYLA